MATEITIPATPGSSPVLTGGYASLAAADAAKTLEQRLAEWLERMTEQTRRAYYGDLKRFAQWLAVGSIGEALDLAANADRVDPAPRPTLRVLERYRDALYGDGAGRKSTSVMRSIAAINSALVMLAKAGIGPGSQDVTSPPSNVIRGTRRGPRQQTVSAILARLENATDTQSVRDAAIVSLLARCALRRGEVVSLNLEDVDQMQCRIAVLGKGRRTREWMAINEATCTALSAWMSVRAEHAGSDQTALFVGLSNHGAGKRMSGEALRLIVKRAAHGVAKSGEVVRPHGLRHTAATVIIEHTNGNLAAAQHALRHANIRTTSSAYDDSAERSQRTAIDLLGRVL